MCIRDRVIAEIAPRKNVFVRPPVANLDVLFLVASTTQPTPSTLVPVSYTHLDVYKRQEIARNELAQQDKFTLKLVNDEVDACAARLYDVCLLYTSRCV